MSWQSSVSTYSMFDISRPEKGILLSQIIRPDRKESGGSQRERNRDGETERDRDRD